MALEFGNLEIGILAYGILIGILLARTIRRHGMDWKRFFAVAVFLGGGAVSSFSLDEIFKLSSSSFSFFWIGLLLGFFANMILKQISVSFNLPEFGPLLKR